MVIVLSVVVYLLTGVLVSHWVGLQPVVLIRDIQAGKAPSGFYAFPSWRIAGGLASLYVITITTWPIAGPLWWWSVRRDAHKD